MSEKEAKRLGNDDQSCAIFFQRKKFHKNKLQQQKKTSQE